MPLLWPTKREPRCIAFGGIPVDDSITKQVLEAVQPVAVEAAVLAHEEQSRVHVNAFR